MAELWRLLRDPPAAAPWNMSVDEALLACVRAGRATLRLYQFAAPAVTLGYRQAPPPWLARARAMGLDLARRPSGGGSVLHVGDLVYCVAAPRELCAVPRDARGAHGWVSKTLALALSSLGLAVEVARGERDGARSELCFAVSAADELELGGRKLVGSAQRRLRSGWLQHGSIRLRDDAPWYEALLGSAAPPRGSPPCGLEAETVAEAIVKAFEARLGCRLRMGALDAAELAAVELRELHRQAAPLATPTFCRAGAGCAKTADSLRR